MSKTKIAIEAPTLKGGTLITVMDRDEFVSLIQEAIILGAQIKRTGHVYEVGAGEEVYTLTTSTIQ